MTEPAAPVTPVATVGLTQSGGRLVWRAGGLVLHLLVDDAAPVRVAALLPAPPPGTAVLPEDARDARATPLVELDVDGEGRTVNSPAGQRRRFVAGGRLRHVSHAEAAVEGGRELRIVQRDGRGLAVTSVLSVGDGLGVLHAQTGVALDADAGRTVRLRHVGSLALTGFVPPADRAFPRRLAVHRCDNAWAAEYRWQTLDLTAAGLVDISSPRFAYGGSHAALDVTGSGSWSSGNHLPAGGLTDTVTGTGWSWQIEHDGAWQWQLADHAGDVWLGLSGPSDVASAWSRVLAPGDAFASVGVAVAVSPDGFEGALRELTRHRRAVRRPNADDAELPVVFNDYMNGLDGDPTTARELPLVAAAAAAGAEYFVIDAGWYADDAGWWSSVGDWQESRVRFPGGLAEVFDAVRAAGMVPGLWVEPEVVGVESAAARELPEDAFFARDGVRLTENKRHHLDFRHPAVRTRLDAVIDRLVADLGVGYVKFDYNICIAPGTDVGADSPGDGLLGHNRAYLDFLDGLLARHPGLVVENCSSGGMRVDHALLQRLSLQSTSDQQDPLRYVPIAAAAPSAMTPEQAATWAYPQPDWPADVNDVTLLNPLLGRIHLSGRLADLDATAAARVAEAVAVYKAYRHRIPHALPSWPLGLPGWEDSHVALALTDDEGTLLQVWRRGGTTTVVVPLPALAGRGITPRTLFGTAADVRWDPAAGTLTVVFAGDPGGLLVALTDT